VDFADLWETNQQNLGKHVTNITIIIHFSSKKKTKKKLKNINYCAIRDISVPSQAQICSF